MNSFGQIFRVSIFGESHGEAVGVVLDGVPTGIALMLEDFYEQLERRKGGQKATTPRVEKDEPKFISGWFNGCTTGAPLTIIFENQNIRSSDYEKSKEVFRPGHADFTANKKFGGFNDYRGGGHFSGRLTVAMVAAGVVAEKVLQQLIPSAKINATIQSIAGEKEIDAGIQKAIEAKDSVGGIIDCCVKGLPVGLGEPFFNSVESVISHLVFSIPAVKGIQFGSGFAAAEMFGSEHNDVFIDEEGQTKTNHAGGINGGITNGNDLQFTVVVKPTSSTPKEQTTFNFSTKQMETLSVKGRHDLCIALRVPPVLEAITAIALADLALMHKALKIN